MRLQGGFTLIELLVVIAILGILAGIIFPVFSRAREKGRQTTCISNLRQLGEASRIYQQEFDGFYVPHGGYNGHQFGSGIDALAFLVRDPGIFVCPSANALEVEREALRRQHQLRGPATGIVSTYEFNPSARLNLANPHLRAANPSAAGMMADYPCWGRRHLGGTNILFVDGHVKWFPHPKMFGQVPWWNWGWWDSHYPGAPGIP
ncbi:MAG TPA: DUF1559 domain-containing protein [Armatimonadetes bacterium]|nr:DUF1559 domain-containing protein [Armatimonadota bacterium]